jgi:hypothetical protein
MDMQELIEAYEYDIISEIEYAEEREHEAELRGEAGWIAELEYEIENSQNVHHRNQADSTA